MMKAAGIAFLAIISIGGTACGQESPRKDSTYRHRLPSAAPSRQADMAEKGSRVMPFDLDRSTHVFEPIANGGVQTVVSRDGAPDQVALIRQHLSEEATAFGRGDYASPASIHGADMPGLSELTGSAGRVQITFESIDRGGRVRFVSAEPQLVAAIHEWFDAQMSDHGAHAAHGPH